MEYLSDPKIQRLTCQERSCWVTMLCLASMDNGSIKNVQEDFLMERSGIDPMGEEWNRTRGFLTKFELLGFITMDGSTIVLRNWQKRQEVYSESRDRVKRWREKQRLNDDVTLVTLHSNGKSRVDESRIDLDAKASKIEEVRETPEDNRPSRSKKVTPQMQQVFDLFRDNPARLVWKTRVHQREAAKVLFDEVGIDLLRIRYDTIKRFSNQKMFPRIDDPSELLEKMPAVADFLKKNELV